MTNPRPILTHCKQGHERKQVTTTKVWYCPICATENRKARDERLRAARQSKRGITNG